MKWVAILVLLFAFSSTPVLAGEEWCDTDPVVTIQHAPYHLTIYAQGAQHLAAIEDAFVRVDGNNLWVAVSPDSYAMRATLTNDAGAIVASSEGSAAHPLHLLVVQGRG